MKIPSYDDLTPGISDVHPRDTFHGAAGLLPGAEAPVVPHPPSRGALRRGRPSHVPPRSTSHAAPAFALRRYGAAGPRTPHVLFACVRARGANAAGLLSLAKDFSPRLERHGSDAIVLDVSGLGRLLGDAHGIAAALQQAAAECGLEVRIAVAPTQIAARLLTLHQGLGSQLSAGRTRLRAARDGAAGSDVARRTLEAAVVTGDVAAALAGLPLDLLEAENGTGADGHRKGARPASVAIARTFDALRRWGLRTIGEFAALPADELAARFGAAGVALQGLARGVDPRPLVPDPGVPRFVESMELEWPLDQLEPLSFVLARLLEPLSSALEQADRGAAAIRLDLRLVDRTTHTRVLQLPAPMRDPRVLRTLLLLDLESHPPTAAIDIVTVEIDPAPGRIVQFSLLERAIPSPETLATLAARLGALVGEDRCGSPALLDSYRPDAFEVRPFHPRERAPLRLPRTLESPNPGTIEPPHLGRPASPAPRPLLLRRFRPPVAVRVAVDRGRPANVAIDRRGMPGGRVTQAAGPWRTSGAWWDTTGGGWDRDEWEVALSDGSVCSLYQDRETAQWFLHGVFD